MKHILRLLPLTVTLAVCGCTETRARRFDCAAVLPTRLDYRISLGATQVLHLSRASGIPIPDSFSGYSLYLQLEPSLVKDGATIQVPSSGAACFLSVLNAPVYRRTDSCTGSITITSVRDTQLKAHLKFEAANPQWSFTGDVAFQSAVLTSAFHGE